MEHRRYTSHGKDTLIGTSDEFALLGKAIVIARNQAGQDEKAAYYHVGEAIAGLDVQAEAPLELEMYSDRIESAVSAVRRALGEVTAYQIISGQASPIAADLEALHQDIVPQRPADHL